MTDLGERSPLLFLVGGEWPKVKWSHTAGVMPNAVRGSH
jgi:hypothetical protein